MSKTLQNALALGVGITLALGIVMGARLVNLTHQTNKLALDLKHELVSVQVQRYDATFNACWDQNRRHDATVGALDVVLSRAAMATPARRAAIEESRAPTLLLIDALAPKRNCAAAAAAATKSP